MADNYLECKREELEARRASLHAKEQRKRQAAYKKRLEAYRKKLEEQKKSANIIIRPACKEDADVIVQCVMMAIPVEGLTQMGNGISEEDLAKVLKTVAQMDDAIYSWRNVIVAEIADDVTTAKNHASTVAGAIIAYNGSELHRLRRPLEDLLEKYVGLAAHEWDDETSEGEFYIDTLAVNPKFRGKKIGTMLIEATCRKAAALGHSKVGLLVDVENPMAEKLYTRMGFEFAEYLPFFKHTYKHLQRKI